MSNLLFVYGTLMADFDSAMARFLKDRAQFLGEGWAHGVLLDLGQYPGFKTDAGKTNRVRGHVFELQQPEKLLDTLDAYEGIDPKRPQDAEYSRELLEVHTSYGPLSCWTYLFTGSVEGVPRIPFEYYPDFVRQTPAHQRFLRSG